MKASQRVEDDVLLSAPEMLDRLFLNSKIKMTKFYDLRKRGAIVECPYIKGRYLYNQTRVNLGLPPVDVKSLRKELEVNCEE